MDTQITVTVSEITRDRLIELAALHGKPLDAYIRGDLERFAPPWTKEEGARRRAAILDDLRQSAAKREGKPVSTEAILEAIHEGRRERQDAIYAAITSRGNPPDSDSDTRKQ